MTTWASSRLQEWKAEDDARARRLEQERTVRAEEDRRRADDARRQAEAEQHAATLAEYDLVKRLVAIDPIGAYRRHIDFLLRTNAIKVVFRPGASGRSWGAPKNQRVEIPPIVSEQDAATAYHEIGHILNGPCPLTPPHYREMTSRETVRCVRCEIEAWKRAIDLCPLWTEAMHSWLAQSLQTYRNSTMTWVDHVAELDALCGRGAFRRIQEARRRFELRVTRQQRIDSSLARNTRPMQGRRAL